MTIKQKLNISIITISAILLLGGTGSLLGYRYLSSKASLANEFDKEAMYLQMMLRGVNEVIITESTPASVEIAQMGVTGFNETHNKLIESIDDPKILAILKDKVDPIWKKVKENVKPFTKTHSVGYTSGADALMVKYGGVIADTTDILNQINELSVKTSDVVNKDSKISGIIQIFLISGIIAIIIVFFISSRQVYRSMMHPINDLLNIAHGFSKGDLSIRMAESSKDEFSALAVHFNNALENLSGIISQVKYSTDILTSNAINISSSVTQIAGNTRDQSSQTAQAAAATEELNNSVQDVARNSVDAAESSKVAATLAVKGGEVVRRTIEGMGKIEQAVKESAGNIESLGKNSDKIGEIIKVIDDIAGQTNLLALNAAIEAARAGEQGRGFAVVADEVRKLAEKTTHATKEISEMIQSIQLDTQKAVSAMQDGTKEVGTGVKLVNEAGEALQQIVTSVQNVTDMIQQIAAAAEEQTGSGRDIASNIESVAILTNQTAESAQHSSELSQKLNSLASDLQNSVSALIIASTEADGNTDRSKSTSSSTFSKSLG